MALFITYIFLTAVTVKEEVKKLLVRNGKPVYLMERKGSALENRN